MDTLCHLRVKGSIKTVTLAACVAHVAVPHWVAFATAAQRQTTLACSLNWTSRRRCVGWEGGGVCKVYSHENMKALATNCLTSAAIESAAASNAQLATRHSSQRAACNVQRGARFKRMQITIVEHKWCRNKHECRCKSVDKRGKRRLLLLLLLAAC